MGLCKCEKRKVTNLFCFEHKVNVCENCMVSTHDSCIIQTYLAWLSDSDFLPVCKLCEQPNTFSACIRFPCLHIFHVECINGKFSKFPKNTAPAGFKCPECNDKVFPALNAGGPLALQVKEKLKDYSWARTGLGLPLLKNSSSTSEAAGAINQLNESHLNQTQSSVNLNIDEQSQSQSFSSNHMPNSQISGVKQRKQVRINDNTEINIPEGGGNTGNNGAAGTAYNNQSGSYSPGLNPADPNRQSSYSNSTDREDKAFRPPTGAHRTPDVDFKAFKYRRKSIAQRIKRLLQNHYASQKYYEPIMGHTTPILVCLIIVVSLVFIWMTTSVVRHHRNDYDPVLDPYRNPNIKIGNSQVEV